jgi:glycosyltransferase involved in cell wall biosynthesis
VAHPAGDPSAPAGREPRDALVAELAELGVRRVHALQWRDLDDDEAGGSEVHADEVLRRWAAAGLDVTLRTSAARSQPAEVLRHGYRVVRRGGRHTVFPRAVAAEVLRRTGPRDALIEIWNGVPWLSPLWCRGPRVTWLHHIHGPMWDQVLPGPLAHLGRFLETDLAPRCYRTTQVVTLAEPSRDEIASHGVPRAQIHVVPPGVDPVFSAGGPRHPRPLIVSVGRLAPVKRFELLIAAAAEARRTVPDLELVIVGEGYERPRLEALCRDLDAERWVSLPGRVPLTELVALYRRAWVLASASLAEGWGMSLTEGAACGTPAVATAVTGHRHAVQDGVSGILVEAPAELGSALGALLRDDDRRAALGRGALAWAAQLTWDRTADDLLVILRDAARAHHTASP